MGFNALLPQTVTIKTVSDGALDAARNWTRTETSAQVQGRLEQINSTEPDTGGVGVEDRWRLFLPAGTALTAADEVVVGIRRFQVFGSPARVFGRHREHHVEAVLTYVGDVSESPDA